MIKVGVVIPGGPPKLGDIWVSEALIATVGEAEVRRMVRKTFEAAHRQWEDEKRRRRSVTTGNLCKGES